MATSGMTPIPQVARRDGPEPDARRELRRWAAAHCLRWSASLCHRRRGVRFVRMLEIDSGIAGELPSKPTPSRWHGS